MIDALTYILGGIVLLLLCYPAAVAYERHKRPPFPIPRDHPTMRRLAAAVVDARERERR